jgi:peptide/nickel transport system ATP-binding protein
VKALEVAHLQVVLHPAGHDIVRDVTFSVERGEVVGLVGESGSGKTTVALALLGHARRGTRIAGGSVRIEGTDLLDKRATRVRAARGRSISYVPQDPAAALNPALTIGKQLLEVIETHRPTATSREALDRVRETLGEVRLPTDATLLGRYPHQLSGGQQQRVCIAMAFLLRPPTIVLDEPTTGLDVITQAHVLETVRELCSEHQVGAVYVSHDLAVVAGLADRVLVMYAGRLVESAAANQLFEQPGHPYTRRLIQAIPDISVRRSLRVIPGQVPAPGRRPRGCVFAPRCPDAIDGCQHSQPGLDELGSGHLAACIRAGDLPAMPRRPLANLSRTGQSDAGPTLVVRNLDVFHGSRQVLEDISLTLGSGECVALVGESGSGKTTLARTIMGLHFPMAGEIILKGDPLAGNVRTRPLEVRRSLQLVFQSPYNSLNPRRTIGQIVGVPIEHFFGLRGKHMQARVSSLLERVSLPRSTAKAYPDELSGGERQRVAIARAIACKPEVLVCDEITSALDVSVQAAIVDLLEGLRSEENLAVLFVTHNLALVRTIADRVLVLNQGEIVESGPTDAVIGRPLEAYTQQLIAGTPTLTHSL